MEKLYEGDDAALVDGRLRDVHYCRNIPTCQPQYRSTISAPSLCALGPPRHETHIQNYSERRGANDYSVTFNNTVSENQPLEDSVRGGHLQTDSSSMQNDLALGHVGTVQEWLEEYKSTIPTWFKYNPGWENMFINHASSSFYLLSTMPFAINDGLNSSKWSPVWKASREATTT